MSESINVIGAQTFQDSLTRDKAREIFKESFTFGDFEREDIDELVETLGHHMASSGKYRICRKYSASFICGRLRSLEITCVTDEWKGLEAVTFNADGFIGFAGWADSENIKPILVGFVQWCDLMTVRKGGEL